MNALDLLNNNRKGMYDKQQKEKRRCRIFTKKLWNCSKDRVTQIKISKMIRVLTIMLDDKAFHFQ